MTGSTCVAMSGTGASSFSRQYGSGRFPADSVVYVSFEGFEFDVPYTLKEDGSLDNGYLDMPGVPNMGSPAEIIGRSSWHIG